MFGRVELRVLAVAVLLLVAVGWPEGVSAAVSESHCVIRVVGQQGDGRLVLSSAECFETFGEALTAASGGSTVFAKDVSGSDLMADESTLGVTVASFALGIHFDGSNGSGSSITVVGSSCSGGYWNTGSVWENRISSSWNGCYRLRHFDGPARTGSWVDTVGAGVTHDLAWWMNDRTESVAYLGS